MFGVVPKSLWSGRLSLRRTESRGARDAAARGARRANDAHRRGHRGQGRRDVPQTSSPSIGGATSITRSPTPACRPRTSTSCWPRTCTSIMPAGSRCATLRPSAPAVSAGALRRPPRRVGRCDPSARAERAATMSRTTSCRWSQAGVLEMVDDDQTIMPGVTVRRTGGHTGHHQMVWIESNGQHAAFSADLMPTTAHLSLRLDRGGRSVPDGDARGEADVRGRGGGAPDARVLRSRSPDRTPRTSWSRTAGESLQPV